MKFIQDNIFNITCDALFIPTNGSIKKNGDAVMGKGLAKQTADKWPHIPARLGCLLQDGNHTYCLYQRERGHIYSFPTKNNWQEKASLKLIEQSLNELNILVETHNWNKILLPKIGCGCGQLNWESQVLPLIKRTITEKTNEILWIVERAET